MDTFRVQDDYRLIETSQEDFESEYDMETSVIDECRETLTREGLDYDLQVCKYSN